MPSLVHRAHRGWASTVIHIATAARHRSGGLHHVYARAAACGFRDCLGRDGGIRRPFGVVLAFETSPGDHSPDGAFGSHQRSCVDKAIDFELPDQEGQNWRLADHMTRGPVLLVFYRGDW